ncbi:peptidase S15 [Mycobacteroides abscessus subsp. abscessus]|uniref:alpha/beta hydrolase family protein n=1 Tax=Mycobacteroides abscessus TaxID=36809 RepID=UPI00092A23E1|nr:CocE/NonD family hydrolase [Mycobacteroides abscessus]SHO86652.1 peptidase S15 [Mycobacteroides abscessus subsp. abscessus]SHP08150.1 peptidase S15 [Mycobacteroides abscessus subsp. abscessus]SHP62358.1 peptidase S15 [Mycobacteroides abscessus subsp. abscessus]SHP69052.1 peptidase S15 [Mycobacteroides abscessus subsp. abscessus]
MLVAAACVIALVLGTGGWIIYANDFAIREERLTIPGSVQPLQATLALPKDGNGPFGLVVFIHGDGPADATRDGFYKPIWESFAKAGYASLSWNKPGIGGAAGNWLDQSMHDRATEAEAAIRWARGRADIDPRRIGMWGISQGGWVVPEVAARTPDLQFVILVGAAVNWLRQGEFHTRAVMQHHGASESDITAALDRHNATLQPLRGNANYAQYLAAHTDPKPMSADRWNFVRKNYLADVTGMLPQVKVPVLLALGDEDLNVDVNETERIYRQLLPPQQLTVQRYPHASHNIVKAALDNDQNWRSTLVALFAPRSLYAPGYLENMRNYVAGQPVH